MTYKFSLRGTRRGELRMGVNPFTAQSAMLPTFVMSDDERAVVLAVITRHGGAITAGAGALVLAGAELLFEDLGGPRSRVSIEGAIEPAIAILFEIASAGRLIVTNEHEKCDEPIPIVTTAEAQAQAIASEVEYDPPEIVTDIGRFLRVLLPGYDRVR